MHEQTLRNDGKTPAPAGEAAIEAALDNWINAINAEDAKRINALYKDNAVLLATFDPTPRETPQTREDYFVFFKTRRHLHAKVDLVRIAMIGEDAGVASGIYIFNFVDEKDKPQTAKARFTFAYERQETGNWLIVAHHSSQAPVRPQISP